MSLIISTLAVAIAVTALIESRKPKAVELRYIRANRVNPPLPPLPEVETKAVKPVLPYFIGHVGGGYRYDN